MNRKTPDWAQHFMLYLGTGALIFIVVYVFAGSCTGGHG